MTAVLPLPVLPLLRLNANSKLKGRTLTLKDHTFMIAPGIAHTDCAAAAR